MSTVDDLLGVLDDEPEDAPGEGSVRAPWHTSNGIYDLLRPQPWMDDALCAQADPDSWFPEKGGAVGPAVKICRRCPVAAECLDYALANGERYGVWGGVSERPRRHLLDTDRPA